MTSENKQGFNKLKSTTRKTRKRKLKGVDPEQVATRRSIEAIHDKSRFRRAYEYI